MKELGKLIYNIRKMIAMIYTFEEYRKLPNSKNYTGMPKTPVEKETLGNSG